MEDHSYSKKKLIYLLEIGVLPVIASFTTTLTYGGLKIYHLTRGWNNNPSVEQFQHIFRCLVTRCGVTPGSTDSTQHIKILHNYWKERCKKGTAIQSYKEPVQGRREPSCEHSRATMKRLNVGVQSQG
ncbi:uncharacterized protein [Watersipora subatra]|uniref:uncharacterized protein isoform X2 n=1 Tax=Watersipora subatra TaxID=2589382 RepID=UPI00355B58A5